MASLPNVLGKTGISAFGIGMPILSPRLINSTGNDVTPITVNDEKMSLSLASGSWLSPVAGMLTVIAAAARPDTTLVLADGLSVNGPGMLLTLFPQLYLRLSRLYAQVLETASATRPESDLGLPVRPVPRYFFFAGAVSASNKNGKVNPEDEVGLAGELTIHDTTGMAIDPLAVASAFQAFMVKDNILQHLATGASFTENSQIKAIANLTSTPSVVRLRLASHSGAPYDGTHLRGITAVHSASGLFTLNASSGSGSGLTGSITKDPGTGATGSFSDDEQRLLLIGPATTGRLTDKFSPPALPSGVSLARDFFNVRVEALKQFLLGAPNTGFDGAKLEKQAPIRIHEPLTLLTDGNDVLAAANAALSGTTQESLCVAQAIDGDFNTPTQAGSNARWPEFPPLASGTIPDTEGPLPVKLRDSFAPTAAFFDDNNSATANVDVVLTLNGLPPHASIRVYPRKFIEDAREARGDGTGGVVPDSGVLKLLLKDPLALRRPGIPDSGIVIPSPATLRFDVMIVRHSKKREARLYGNVTLPITGTDTADPSPSGTNPFGKAARRGVSNAGILGLGKHVGLLPSDPLAAITALTGEGNPRDASRWPTMARRDLLVAGLVSSNWWGVIAGGRLTKETHSADARLGAPGGQGGRETQVVGISTQVGRLAYDIARMAFRRTSNIVTRIVDLADDKWNEPAQPHEVAPGTQPGTTAGTFAGAVLQTTAPFCETPELNILKTFVNPADFPKTFNDLVDWVNTNLLPQGVPLRTQLVKALNGLKSNSTLNETTRERLFDEMRREILSSCFGRRDTQWALEGAISNARHSIYIETPGFASTQRDYRTAGLPEPPYVADLLQVLRSQIRDAPGLRVIICSPKYADFAPGYEPEAAYEVSDRRARILDLPSERVVSFHPIGFPGRSSRLESFVVIVDDVWALVGSSSFRRRGLTFDGGSDLLFTDTNLVNGRSPAIANFRRQLMANRLGVQASETSSFGPMPNANFVRLDDGVEAFYVIREMLIADGLGKIDRLWNGQTPGIDPLTPASIDLANPEGLEFDLAAALALTKVANLNSF